MRDAVLYLEQNRRVVRHGRPPFSFASGTLQSTLLPLFQDLQRLRGRETGAGSEPAGHRSGEAFRGMGRRAGKSEQITDLLLARRVYSQYSGETSKPFFGG